VIRGEAGIGKSRCWPTRPRAPTGCGCLRGIGVSRSRSTRSPPSTSFSAGRRHLDGIPARQRAALRGAFGLEEAGDDRFLVSVAILSVLAEVAEEQPLLCLVDDAQWLDGASADALTFAARGWRPRASCCCSRPATTRPGLRRARAARTALGGLDATAARRAAGRGGTGGPRGPRPAGGLDRRQPARTARTARVADRRPARRPGAAARPAPGRARRRAGLPGPGPAAGDDTQTLLLVAAAEDTGDLDVVLRAAAELGVPPGALDDAEKAGLVRVESTTVAFHHPLVRSAVYRGCHVPPAPGRPRGPRVGPRRRPPGLAPRRRRGRPGRDGRG
jgi:hypothetical protein